MFHCIHTVIIFKHVNFGKNIWLHTSKIIKKRTHFKISYRDEVFTRLFFFFFFISEWNFILVFLTEMSSSWEKISSRQKRVNSKRHFTMDRDDFIPGWNFTCKHPLKIWAPSEHFWRENFLRCKKNIPFLAFNYTKVSISLKMLKKNVTVKVKREFSRK